LRRAIATPIHKPDDQNANSDVIHNCHGTAVPIDSHAGLHRTSDALQSLSVRFVPRCFLSLSQALARVIVVGRKMLFFSLRLRLIVLVLNDPHSALTREPVPHFGRVLQLLSLFQRFHLSR
jgi:hypothetical protein